MGSPEQLKTGENGLLGWPKTTFALDSGISGIFFFTCTVAHLIGGPELTGGLKDLHPPLPKRVATS